jgi:4-hydroxy-tetrahydrodipicolinate synthase
MIDQGVDGLCIIANYSEQFLLSDAERDQLMRVCLEYVGHRLPVIVTCSHFSTQVVEDRCRTAADLGADMIMLMPPYHGVGLQADETAIFEHFERAANAGGIPIMVQDAPLSGVQLSVSLLARMAQSIPLLQYFKIETPQAAGKLRALIAQGGDDIVGPFDGEEGITLMADLDAGATGTMCSALMPDLIRPVLEAHRVGDRATAAQHYQRILPLINYENRQCGLRATKVVMKEGGVIRSDHVRHPLAPLDSTIRTGLLELVRQFEPLALRWGI